MQKRPQNPSASGSPVDDREDREDRDDSVEPSRSEVLAQAVGGLEALEALAGDATLLAELDPDDRRRLLIAAGRISRPERDATRAIRRAFERKERDARRERDEAVLEDSGIRSARRDDVFATPSALQTECESPPRRGRRQLPHRRAPVAPSENEPTGNLPDQTRLDVSTSHSETTVPALQRARNCYVCKADFSQLHRFYDSMCSSCADFNWLKRIQTTDLTGRVALVTGGRVKIGYQCAIKLLRAGASVIVTTRFPRNAASRFSKEADFAKWSDRLEVHGLDLRHTPSVEALTEHLNEGWNRLDFLINNACQTVRRPPGFYRHMMEEETTALASLAPEQAALLRAHSEANADSAGIDPASGELSSLASALVGLDSSAELSQLPLLPDDFRDAGTLFPDGAFDADLQQVDLRDKNSWRLRLDEVPAIELLEVHLVNAVAPFILNSRLKPLMQRVASADKHIVNVSAMEGQFYRSFKTDRHPHTNMAKAALNMMTRTSAPDYIREGIHMNSVDTGWITDEDGPRLAAQKREEHGFHPPLDIVDAAARICDPIFSGFNTGRHVWGQFLKDYRPTDW